MIAMRRTAILVWLVALLLVPLPGGRGPGSQAEAGPAEPGRIAYIGDDWNVHLADEDGSNEKALTSDARLESPRRTTDPDVLYSSPIWSPDGQHILSVRRVRVALAVQEQSLVIFDVPDGAPMKIPLEDAASYVEGADWTTDHEIVVAYSPTTSYEVNPCFTQLVRDFRFAVINIESGEEALLYEFPYGRFPEGADVSPDGKFIAYSINNVADCGLRGPLCVFEIATSAQRCTTDAPYHYNWSFDSRQVLFHQCIPRYCDGGALKAFDAVTGQETLLKDGEPLTTFENPISTPDGRHAIYLRLGTIDYRPPNEGLWVLDTALGREQKIDDRGTPIEVSPDGEWVLYSKNDGIWIAALEGDHRQLLLEGARSAAWQPLPTPCSTTCSEAPNGLNTCDLQAGDILLSQQVGGLYAAENLLFNGYWTHAGIYNGCGMITESSGHCDSWWQLWTCSDKPGVEVKPIEDSGFWSAPDWAILRTKSDGGKRDAAVTYAKAQEGKKYNWIYPDKWTTDKFYCSQLVWRAYQKQGIDLDSNQGALNALLKWVGPWGVADAAGVLAAVPPDDIYFDGDVTLVKQRPGIGAALRRAVLRILSPAHLYVTDPEGRHTGVDPNTGQVVEEIPGVFYSGPDVEPEFLSIQDMAGTWETQVIGAGEGSYTLQLENLDAENHRLTEVIGDAQEGSVTTYEATHLGAGWNTRCYAGEPKPVEEALAEIIDSVVAIYRLNPDQTFARWFPGKPDLSTIAELKPYDQLFILTSASADWVQELASTTQTEFDLVQGWNAMCYGGPTAPITEALSGLSGDVAVLYRLGEDQAWARYVPDRPDISNIAELKRLDSVLMLVTAAGGARWTFEPSSTAVASSINWGPGVSLELLDAKSDGLTVTIDGSVRSSEFNIARIVWDWGDGTVEESWLPARHTYAQPGRHTVTVQVYDDSGTIIAGQSWPIDVRN
jgi:uncharacterized protein YycO